MFLTVSGHELAGMARVPNAGLLDEVEAYTMNDSGPFALGIAPKKIVVSTGRGRAGHRSVVSQKRINAGGRQARLSQPL
jgi:hypothetical protein